MSQENWARTKSFTRRGGRMPQRHHRALADHSSRFVADVELVGEGTQVAAQEALDLNELFEREAYSVLEIGSGSGDQLVHAAQEHPDWNFLALEVWRPGIAQTITRAVHEDVDNIRLIGVDAAQAMPILFRDRAFDQVWTFFPDPWPKAKHHKRRLVSDAFAIEVARVLDDGGVWRLATDWADYAWRMRDVVEGSAYFENPYAGRLAAAGDEFDDPRGAHGGFAPRFEGRTLTRFERKGERVERVVRDLAVVRVPRVDLGD